MTEKMRQGTSVLVAVILLVGSLGSGTAVASGVDNQPPLVDPGVDQEVPVNATVVLDAGDSRDPDGTIESYEWQIETPNGSETAPACPSCERTEFTVNRSGTYNATLTVTDDDGAQRSDTMRIHVYTVEKPQVTLEGPTEVLINTSVDFTALMTAGDHPLVRVDWYVDGDRRNTTELEGESATDIHSVRFQDNDTHTVTAQVYDVLGRTDQSSITVGVAQPSPPCENATWDGTALSWDTSECGSTGNTTENSTASNQPPYVQVGDEGYTSIGGPEGVATVPFNNVTMADPDGNIVDTEWEIADRPANATEGFYQTEPETAFLTVDAAGTYRVRLTVEDDDGATASDTAVLDVGYVDDSGADGLNVSGNPCYYPDNSIFSCEEDSRTGRDGDNVTVTDSDQDGQVEVNGTTYNVTTGTSVNIPESEWNDHVGVSSGSLEDNGGVIHVKDGLHSYTAGSDNEMVGDWIPVPHPAGPSGTEPSDSDAGSAESQGCSENDNDCSNDDESSGGPGIFFAQS